MFEQLLPSIRATLVLTFYTGIIFPVVIWIFAQVIFPHQANGSLIRSADKKTIVGSELIGQSFTRPEYFHPRPSAAGSGYAGEASGGTNLGPTSRKLIVGEKNFPGIEQLASAYRAENRLAADFPVPVDAVTRSGSGLDPDISPSNAELQTSRVAQARKISERQVLTLVRSFIQDRQLGFLGEPRVNVLKLNIALDRLKS